MPQREYVPSAYKPLLANGHSNGVESTSSGLHLESTDGDASFLFSFEALRPGLFRTTFSSKTHPLPPHPSTPRPTTSFADGAKPAVETTACSQTTSVAGVTATVDWSGPPVVSLQLDGQNKPIHKDLEFRSYAVDASGIAHYTRYKRDTLHVGLGEKAAPMNLSNRGFILSATDCFGYDIGQILSTSIFLFSSMPHPKGASVFSRHHIVEEHTMLDPKSMVSGVTSRCTDKTTED